MRSRAQAFVASTSLRPMAQQLIQDRSPAAYAGVESYARAHAKEDAGALAWLGVLGAVGVSTFPFLMPSSSNPSQSLTVWNSVSSCTTLLWTFGWTSVFLPTIIAYTSWAFYVMRGKVKAERITTDPHAY